MANPKEASLESYISEGKLPQTLTAAVGRIRLRKMKKADLPVFLYEPLEFLVERSLNTIDPKIFQTIEGFRADMAERSGEFVDVFRESDPLLAISPNRLAGGKGTNSTGLRSLTEVARITSVHPLWGAFLFLCAKNSGARTILELGGGAGISGCYLALSPYCERFITVEGSESRSRLAKHHLGQVAPFSEVVVVSFERGMNLILPTLKDGLDLVFVDGSKHLEENLGLFTRLKPYLNPRCLVIFDDIHWSTEMEEVWKRICHQQGLRHAINAGRMGLVVWEGGEARPRIDTLFGLAGLNLYGMRNRLKSLFNDRFHASAG
jgi:predicted O-methyltransferase YrrM